MKKLILTLVVLALTAPVSVQAITFTATDPCDGTCVVEFDAGLDPNVPPVAMGLTVTVDGSDPCDAITAVDGIDSFFDIYMDYAYNDPCSYTYGAGHPIADPCAAGVASLPSMKFCVSMGGLGGSAKPLASAPMSGTAFVLHADNAVADPCGPAVTGTISLNALRGGVVGSDTEPMATNLSIPFSITISGECFPSSHADYAMWVKAGKPDCWCNAYQCKGDANGGFGGKDKDGKRQWVTGPDLTILSNGWQKVDT
ncbi:MAG TPA: hypothetical protein HPP87_07475, partial [Planctomycetes bacterium]|nr:hypothetical protein [Planctomycetota bacterium]